MCSKFRLRSDLSTEHSFAISVLKSTDVNSVNPNSVSRYPLVQTRVLGRTLAYFFESRIC